MINIVLMTLMIAALCGMVLCNRKHRKDFHFQVIALALLAVVIASGGIFMCRIDSNLLLGGPEDIPQHELDDKLRAAQGYVVANYIRTTCRNSGKVLLISPADSSRMNMILLGELQTAGLGTLIHEKIVFPDDRPGDKLINPVADRSAEVSCIDGAIAKHPDAHTVILAGISPSGASLQRLNIYKMSASRRPNIIVIGLNNLNDWAYRMLKEGFFSAIVFTDPVRILPSLENMPENPVAVFNSCYVLITKDNLERNRRFFKSGKL